MSIVCGPPASSRAIGHDAANLPDGAEVIVSTAIGEDNPELAQARERGLTVRHRGELLAELCGEKRLLAVAGTHGKTTTAAMAAWALRAAGADPAFFIGGELPGLGNAGWGGGEWVVAEADESDASFLRLRPEIAVVTNLEMDHHSHWGSIAALRAAFARFAEPARGLVVPAGAGLDSLAAGAEVVRFDEDGPGPAGLELAVPGRHNLLNARAALAAIGLAGADLGAGGRLARGVPRRSPAAGAAGRALGGPRIRRLRSPPDRGAGGARGASRARPRAPDRRLPAPSLLADEGVRRAVRVGPLARRRGHRPRRLPGPRGAGRRARRGQRPRRRPRRCRPDGGRRVCWVPDRRRAAATLAPSLGPGRILVTIGAGDIHRARRRAGRGREQGDEPAGGGRARLSAGAADHRPHRRRRRLVRPPRGRGGADRAGEVGRRRGAAGRGHRVGLEPAGRRRRVPRVGDQARGRAGGGRARRRAPARRRRRAAALGGDEGRRVGADGPRVRGQHPGNRRRRGEDERQRLRRRARGGARVGRRLCPRRPRPAPARGPRVRLPQQQPRPGRGRRRCRLRASPPPTPTR